MTNTFLDRSSSAGSGISSLLHTSARTLLALQSLVTHPVPMLFITKLLSVKHV